MHLAAATGRARAADHFEINARGTEVLLEACRRVGVAVPDSVAVIGVHNDDLLCDLCDPPLSSVISNARRAGYEAAALLDRMMNGDRVSQQVILQDPIGIVTRQSTDVVALTDARMSQALRFIRDHATDGVTVDEVLRAVPIVAHRIRTPFQAIAQLHAARPHCPCAARTRGNSSPALS